MKVTVTCEMEIDEDSLRISEEGREEDIQDQIEYAIERVQKGYDRRVAWSIDYHLNEMMPKWLDELKEDKVGVPGFMIDKDAPTDEHGGFSNEVIDEAREHWDVELTKIKNGFLAAKEIEDKWILETPESPEWIAFNEGFDSFKKCYFGLWN